MKLGILWDPHNPITPVHAVIAEVKRQVDTTEWTFDRLSHPTMPNGSCHVASLVEADKVDALLWIEGGPMPSDWAEQRCRTGGWILNGHAEPTLHTDLSNAFDVLCTTAKPQAVGSNTRWLPLAATTERLNFPPGIHLLSQDPLPPSQIQLAMQLEQNRPSAAPPVPIVFCPGSAGAPHPALFDVMSSGAVAVVGPETDLRDLAFAEEHLIQYGSIDALPHFLEELCAQPERLQRAAVRGPDIVKHLHEPQTRARQLIEYLFPTAQILGGQQYTPQISVLTYCYQYLRRFRFYLESLARQDLPPGTMEIVVVDPQSPDGLGDFLHEFARKHPHLRVVRQPFSQAYHRNRGVCINRAFDLSKGKLIVSTDGDILFPPTLVAELAQKLQAQPDRVFGVRRCFLNRNTTRDVLEGRIDPFIHMSTLLRNSGDGEPESREGVLGYCQAVRREHFAVARYPEEFDRVNQSDIVFLERLRKYASVAPEFLADRAVLHLWHPRNWAGTTEPL